MITCSTTIKTDNRHRQSNHHGVSHKYNPLAACHTKILLPNILTNNPLMSFEGRRQHNQGRRNRGRGSTFARNSEASRGRTTVPANNQVDALSASFASLNIRYSIPQRRPSNQVFQTSRITAQSGTPVVPARTVSANEIKDYVKGIVNTVAASQSEIQEKKEVCSSLQAIVRRVIPDAELKVMGGVANTFALKDCDVDVCIITRMGLDTFDLERLATEFRRVGKIQSTAVLNCRPCHRTPSAYICPAYQTSR